MKRRVKGAVRRVRGLVLDTLLNRRGYARARRREHVLCMGDSHVDVLRRVKLRGVWFRVHALPGATASGILNPNSRTNAYQTFTRLVQRAKPWQHVLVGLGEVDCGFIIWHRAQRHGISVDDQLTETLDNYCELLRRFQDRGFRSVMVLSVPLPTISDYPSQWAEIANVRKEVTATQLERTGLTLRFNAALRERCERMGVIFVNATREQLDPATGIIRRELMRPDDRDHHLADAPYARLATRALREAGVGGGT